MYKTQHLCGHLIAKTYIKLLNDYIKDETRNKLTVKLNIYELEVARER